MAASPIEEVDEDESTTAQRNLEEDFERVNAEATREQKKTRGSVDHHHQEPVGHNSDDDDDLDPPPEMTAEQRANYDLMRRAMRDESKVWNKKIKAKMEAQNARISRCEEAQARSEERLKEVEGRTKKEVTSVAQHLGAELSKQKTETDQRIEAIEKRMQELMEQQQQQKAAGAWGAWRGTGGSRSTGDGEWQPTSIVIFACLWKEKDGPKAVGRQWITTFLERAQEKLIEEHGESYKDVFGKWRLQHAKSYKVEVALKDPDMVWEMRSILAKMIEGATDLALRGPKGDAVRIGVERTREEKARFKWLAALETVLQGSLTQMVSQKRRVLPNGVSVADVVKSDGRTFNIMVVGDNESETVAAHVGKDLTIQEVDEELLQAIGITRDAMTTQLRQAVGGR